MFCAAQVSLGFFDKCQKCARHQNRYAAHMNFPPGLQFHENNRLLVWRPRGLLDEKVVSDVVAALGRLEMELHEPFNRFSDTVGVEQVDLNYEYVISVALYRRFAYAHRKPIKSAILATHPQFIHYAQMHALFSTRGSTIDVPDFPGRTRGDRAMARRPR